MSNKILVTYATRAGSTKEVAEFLGNVLSKNGLVIEVLPVKSVKSLEGYSAVILGSAARLGHLMPETVSFVKRFQRPLQSLTTAYFVVCLTMKEDTPENRATVDGYFKPIERLVTPVSKGLFAGVMDSSKLGFPWKSLMKNTEQGDYRRWDDIRAWAGSLLPEMAILQPSV